MKKTSIYNKRSYIPIRSTLFDIGGLMPYVNWRDPRQSRLATSISQGMINTFSVGNNDIAGNFGKGNFSKPTLFTNNNGPTVNSTDAGSFFNKDLTLNPDKNAGKNTSSTGKGAAMQAIGSAALNTVSAIDTGDRNGLFDTLDPVYHLAGGRESKVGNALSDTGVSLTKSGNPWLMLAGAGLKIVGGLTNAAFGIKTDQAGLNAANLSIATNSNFISNALSYDDIKGPASMTNTKIYEGGWFSGGKADDMNNALASHMHQAYSWVDRSILNNANNIGANMISNLLRKLSAFGGPLNTFGLEGYINPSSAIGYSLYTDKYAKDKAKDDSHMTNMFAGTSMFDFGGGIHTKGTDFDNGISYINVGGTHEENPNEGVQMGVDNQGVPNLVEEGEVRWNDYIFSDRLTVSDYKNEYKKKSKDIPYEAQVLWEYRNKTFADAAKRIVKKNGEGNDPITIRGNEAQLAVLALVLEKEREKEKLREMQEAIDNMSPEEFAMLQQQMESLQAAQQQQEAAMQQQQMIPLGMELMQPVLQMQPIAALGGLLDNYDRKFEYGGDLKAFTEDLLKYGLTINDYLKYLVDSNKIKGDYDIYAEMGLTDDEFDKNLAEDYIKHIKSSTKKVERLYKTLGKNPKQLKGSALLKYNEDIQKAIKNPALLLNDENKELFVNQVGKGDIKTFSAAADNAVVKENKWKTFGNPMTAKDGKFAVEYSKPADAAEDWKPEPAHVIDNPVFILDGKFVDKEGNVVDNPYEGHGLTSPTRDWSKFGYVNPKDQSWTDVDYSTAPKDASGNELYKYQAWDKWFKDSKMDADEYEGLDAYINNYLDFLDDIYTEGSNAENATAEEKALYLRHKQAMLRLYAMGEATKSKNPKDLEGKNRYFDTEREGFDADNLTLDDIRVINGYNVLNPNNLEGLAPNKLDGYKDKLYYVTKYGYLIPEEDYNRLEGTDKDKYTPLKDAAGEARKGLTRNDLFNHVKSLRNNTGLTLTLLWNSMFDNVPAQSYLMAPRASNRYALVDKNGLFILKDGKRLYIDPDVVNNGLYSIYNNGNPIVLDTVGDATIGTIGVLGGEYNPHVAVVDGEYYNLTPEQAQLYAKYKVTDLKKISSYTGFEDAIPGYTVSPTYYELPDELLEEAGLKVKDGGTEVYKPGGVPKPTLWPLFAAMGVLGLGLLHNIASPIDYSNADALLTASRDAGNYFPIEYRPRGKFVPYRPEDPLFTTYPIILQYNTTAKSILNSGVNQGSKNAAMMANAYASNEAQGKATLQRLVNNTDALSKSIIANNDLYKTWSEGFLKADMANLDAATRAAGFKLEGMKHALAMKQGLLDAKANAINAGLSGLAELAYNYGNNKTLTDLLRWGMQNEIWGPRATYFKGEGSSAAKGGKVRRKRGLGF